MKTNNPLRAHPGAGPKRYCVIIEQPLLDGGVRIVPLSSNGMPATFPSSCSSRYQARKLLRRVRRSQPSARLCMHRTL